MKSLNSPTNGTTNSSIRLHWTLQENHRRQHRTQNKKRRVIIFYAWFHSPLIIYSIWVVVLSKYFTHSQSTSSRTDDGPSQKKAKIVHQKENSIATPKIPNSKSSSSKTLASILTNSSISKATNSVKPNSMATKSLASYVRTTSTAPGTSSQPPVSASKPTNRTSTGSRIAPLLNVISNNKTLASPTPSTSASKLVKPQTQSSNRQPSGSVSVASTSSVNVSPNNEPKVEKVSATAAEADDDDDELLIIYDKNGPEKQKPTEYHGSCLRCLQCKSCWFEVSSTSAFW